MASLTHVKMWSGHSWTHITAEDTVSLHPGGTVSAHRGLFMCDLCGQYVTLTDGKIYTRYFKHSSSEKRMPPRISASDATIDFLGLRGFFGTG